VLALLGCQGHVPAPAGLTSQSGAARVTVAWPARTRLIPRAAESVVVILASSTGATWRQTLNRPASEAFFPTLPAGNLTLRAAAFPQPDGGGTPLATTKMPLEIIADRVATVPLSLASTVVRLEVSPDAVALTVGDTATLTVTARDADNQVVLLSSAQVRWSTSDPAVAMVVDGVVTAVAAGTSTVTVRDTESGVAQPVTITVTPVAAGDHIAYTVASGGAKEIWVMDGDGANPRQLTTFGDTCDELAFSPDGLMIAFIRYTGARCDLYLMNADGSHQRRISQNERFYWGPTFHPNGNSLVAFETFDSDDLITLDLDGGNEKKLTTDQIPDVLPTYLPDGKTIIFNRMINGSYDLYRINADGTGMAPVLSNSSDDWYHAISPDGTRIAYTTGTHIALCDVDGRNNRVFPSAAGVEDKRPTFSPDGTKIAFASNRNGAWQIYAMNVDGTDLRQLTTGPGDHEYPQWGK
jgi:hypothetical protein